MLLRLEVVIAVQSLHQKIVILIDLQLVVLNSVCFLVLT
jgi:hypothetical protein